MEVVAAPRQSGYPAMTLNFPNTSRNYDAKRNLIRFWGYDSALEISFFMEVSALYKLIPQTRNVEAGYLEAFDAARDRIHETARKVYSRSGKGAYLLAATDF
jgi:hypothetical protein